MKKMILKKSQSLFCLNKIIKNLMSQYAIRFYTSSTHTKVANAISYNI